MPPWTPSMTEAGQNDSPDWIIKTGTPGGMCPRCSRILPVSGYCPIRYGCGWHDLRTPDLPRLTVDELMALGQLAGYSKAKTARMILDAAALDALDD